MKDWKEVLLRSQKEEVLKQQTHLEEIEEAFQELCKTKPTKEEFDKYTNGLLLTPKLLYYFVKGEEWERQ